MVLNKEDKDFAKELFDSLDSNKDGKLTKEEIKEGFYKLKIPSAEKDVQLFLNHVDINHDGQISYDEFEKFTDSNLKKLKDVFDSLDTNKNGTLDYFELQESLKKLNLTVYSDQEVSRIFSKIDKNKDGAVDFNEWRELLVLLPNSGLEHILAFWRDAQILDSSFDGGGSLPPMVETKEKKSALQNTITYMVAGSIAGAASRTSTAPLERVKIMYQLNHSRHTMSFLQTCRAVYADGGFRGLFRGNLANILKVSPESAVKFATYEYIKRLFANTDSELTSLQRFVSGAVAGIVSHTSLFPLECVRMRLSAEPAGTYSGIIDCFKKVAQSEGSIKPFYRGLGASIISTIPHSGVNMMVYEFLKFEVIKRTGTDPTPAQLLLCASGSSVCGQLVGYPFHVIKCRLITGGTIANPEKYNGLMDGMKKIIQKEGPKGLYKGIMPNFAKSIPSHGITFVTYEFFKKAFDINLEKEKKHK